MIGRTRFRARRALLPALLVATATALVGPGASAGAAQPLVPGSDVIVSHAPATGTVYEPELLPPTRQGYFRVTTDDGRSVPVYWMPAGSAEAAPLEIQSMSAYRAVVGSGEASSSDVIIYAKGAAVVTAPGTHGAEALSDCSSGWSCLWRLAQYSGQKVQYHDPGNWQNLAIFSFNNDASSAFNNKVNRSTLYASDPDGGGAQECAWAGFVWPQMNSFWNNNISSIKIRNDNNC